MTNSIWTSDYDVVHRASTDAFTLAVAAHPAKMTAKLISQPRNFQVLSWELPGIGTRQEFYVRGDDLVERYQHDSPPLSTEIYTRVLPTADGVELILSRQTSLLDSESGVTLEFQFDQANTVSTLGPQGDWNPPGLGRENRQEQQEPLAVAVGCLDARQYGLLVYPGDSPGITVVRTNEETVQISVPLFSVNLEKGVIRRSRVQVLQAAGSDAMSQLAQRYQAFCSSEIPLTT